MAQKCASPVPPSPSTARIAPTTAPATRSALNDAMLASLAMERVSASSAGVVRIAPSRAMVAQRCPAAATASASLLQVDAIATVVGPDPYATFNALEEARAVVTAAATTPASAMVLANVTLDGHGLYEDAARGAIALNTVSVLWTTPTAPATATTLVPAAMAARTAQLDRSATFLACMV